MVWNQTGDGTNLQQNFDRLLTAMNTTLPNHKQSLQNLANRPISG